MNFPHHPALGLLAVLWAWLEADKPVCTRIALLLIWLSFLQVSQAIPNSKSTPPQSNRSQSCKCQLRCLPVAYEGSGPDDNDRDVNLTVLASRASKQRKESAGFEAPLVSSEATPVADSALFKYLIPPCKLQAWGIYFTWLNEDGWTLKAPAVAWHFSARKFLSYY